MKYIKVLLIIALAGVTFAVSAQSNKELNKKDNSRAHIGNVKGQTALIMKAGHNKTIDLKIEADTRHQLDSIVAGPWGSEIKLKDVDGHKVDVAKANINSSVGLMFTSGSKCVALKKEDLDALKQ